ncbi:MAG: efflux RND transporter periplasmic adaptor subunit [Planctomycetota bacterium]|nr:efflux RND transporter periplasmic adaptor subunit [Planctomycetota bacterium]
MVLAALLVAGIAIGLVIPAGQIRDSVRAILEGDRPDVEKNSRPARERLNVEVTETAQKSLGLKIRRVQLGDYTATYDIPATIRELPGAGSIRISSRFKGLVKKVLVSEGQSVKSGQPLYEIELTGKTLAGTQSDYLLALQRLKNVDQELNRLEPLIREGGLPAKRSLELQYEKKQIQAVINTKYQELLFLGLNQSQVKSIQTQGRLIRNVVVEVPDDLVPPQVNFSLDSKKLADATFVLHSVNALSGTVVDAGSTLCSLAFHEILLVEGQAFEKDLPQLKEAVDLQKEVTVRIGPFSGHAEIDNCRIAFVSNHVREETNIYPFFVYLPNQNQGHPGQSADGYIPWRWKPGQLAHVALPRKHYQQMLVLPREAVAENGVSRIVFQWKGQVEHEHHPDDNHEHADEYVPVEVDVVFMDREFAVINPGGLLKEGTRIAFNSASQLLFSMQSGSGGHSHSHPHPH